MPDDLTDLEHLRQERQLALRYLSEADQRIPHWQEHQDRIADVDAISRGDFHVVFPDESSTTERPKVPNIVQLALDDRAALSTEVPLTIRCDPPSEEAKVKAERRERIAHFYLAHNKAELLFRRFYIDLNQTGVNYKLVLPDLRSSTPEGERFPLIRRIDPRHAFPDRAYSPDREVANLLVTYEESRSGLQALHQDADLSVPAKLQGESDLIRVYEYYDRSEFLIVAELPDLDTAGNRSRRGVILTRMSNKLSRVPVSISARPTHDGQFRGTFDQVLGTLVAENRIFNLVLDGAADTISAPPVYHDIENPQDWGTGVALKAKSPQGFMRRMAPDGPNPTIFPTLAQLGGNARVGSVYPESRQGQISQSIASAAFVSAITGNLSTAVAADQRIEAASWAEVLSICFETDEKYLEASERKVIAGSTTSGAPFSETYRPSRDISGDYRVRASYGAMAGQDRTTMDIRVIQQVNNKLLPRRIGMELLSTVSDVLKAEELMDREGLKDIAYALAAQQAQQGNGAPMAALIDFLDEEDEQNQLFALRRVAELTVPGITPTPQGPSGGRTGPPTGTEAFDEAGALSRGGLAGQNVPGVGALPDLAQLGIAV